MLGKAQVDGIHVMPSTKFYEYPVYKLIIQPGGLTRTGLAPSPEVRAVTSNPKGRGGQVIRHPLF